MIHAAVQVSRTMNNISLPMNRSSLLESVLMMVGDANAASELVLQRSRFCFRFIASLPRCLAHHLSITLAMAATTTETTAAAARATTEPETTGHRAHQRLLEAVQALRSHTETSSALPADIHRALSEALGELGARPPAPDATTTTTTSSTSSTAAAAAAAPVQEAEEVDAATLALATQALVEAVRHALASELSSSEQAAALANAVGLLCNATTSDRVVEAFVAQQALPPLIEVLQRTVPSETSSKHRAHLDAAALSEMLNNAMHGQLPRATAGDAVESDESLLYRSLETARRHAVVALRNISQQQRSRNAVSRAPGLVDALLSLFRNPCETGVVR